MTLQYFRKEHFSVGTEVSWFAGPGCAGYGEKGTSSFGVIVEVVQPKHVPKTNWKTRKINVEARDFVTYIVKNNDPEASNPYSWLGAVRLQQVGPEEPNPVTFKCTNLFAVSLFSGIERFEEGLRAQGIIKARSNATDTEGQTFFFVVSDGLKVRRLLDSLQSEEQSCGVVPVG